MNPHGKNYVQITLNYNQLTCTRIDTVLTIRHHSLAVVRLIYIAVVFKAATAGLNTDFLISVMLHSLIFLILIPNIFVLIFLEFKIES